MQRNHERYLEHLCDRLAQQERESTNKRIIRKPAVKYDNAKRQEQIRREEAQAEHDYLVYRSAEIEFDRDPISTVPDEVKLPEWSFDEIVNKSEYNKVYAEHYMHRFTDTNLEKYRIMSERMLNCHKTWFGDYYKNAGVFNAKRVYHCHNRWCWLCTHLKQAKRLYKFHILFEKLLKEYDLYHVVFTVKNVDGSVLKDTISRMHESLKKIIRYFQGFKKIAGIDFAEYGFVGAIRSFEIVIYPTEYHPHLHCLFLLKKDLNFVKNIINKFSFDKNNPGRVRPFSSFEIMLQKIFYLLMNKQKVTVKNIQSLELGYSCMADLVEGESWHEVFKYATKMSRYGASTCTYEQFVLLDDILRRMKTIQGYGMLYNMDDDIDESDPNAEILFEKILVMLDRSEKPDRDIRFELEKIVDELHKKRMMVISKKMTYKYLKSIVDDLREELMIKDGGETFEPF